MQPPAEPPPSRPSWQWLRWICVLPAAIIVAAAVRYASRIVVIIVRAVSLSALASLGRSGVLYVPTDAAFVLVGAITAPRYRVITAIVLAAIRLGLALVAHVLRPDSVGLTNYTHFAAESLGA